MLDSRLCPFYIWKILWCPCFRSPPDESILCQLHSAPLELLAPRDASSPVPHAVPSGVSASGSESEPVNSGSAASAASSSVAAAFSLAPFQLIPVCSHHLLGTRATGRLTAPSHRPRIGRVAINECWSGWAKYKLWLGAYIMIGCQRRTYAENTN